MALNWSSSIIHSTMLSVRSFPLSIAAFFHSACMAGSKIWNYFSGMISIVCVENDLPFSTTHEYLSVAPWTRPYASHGGSRPAGYDDGFQHWAPLVSWDSALTPRILLGCLYHPAQMETYSDFRSHICFSPWEQSLAADWIREERSGYPSPPWCWGSSAGGIGVGTSWRLVNNHIPKKSLQSEMIMRFLLDQGKTGPTKGTKTHFNEVYCEMASTISE